MEFEPIPFNGQILRSEAITINITAAKYGLRIWNISFLISYALGQQKYDKDCSLVMTLIMK